MEHTISRAACTAAVLALSAALAGCSSGSSGTASSGADTTSGGSGNDIVGLVSADQQTDFEDLSAELGEPTGGADIKLCLATRTLSNEFWGFSRDGFEAAAKKYGVSYETYDVNDESSITEQLDKATSALKGDCSAIIASPISATGLDSVFKDALSQGKPAIVANDAKSTVPGVVYVGPDAEAIGATAADYIAKQLPDGGSVAMVEGDPGSSNALNRGKGFTEELAKYPNLDLVASSTAKWDTNTAQTVAAGMLTANPDIKAFYVQNDGMALGVEAAVAAKGLTNQVLIVGTDGIPQAKKDIADQKGYTATVSEQPMTEGEMAVKTALWLIAGKQVPAWVDVPGFIVDSSNVSQYATGMP